MLRLNRMKPQGRSAAMKARSSALSSSAATPVMNQTFNQIDTVASNNDSVALPAAIPGRFITIANMGASTLAGLARIDCPDSGMNGLAWLEDGRDDFAVHRAARTGGVQSYPFSDYTIGGGQPGALILGFSGVPVERMKRHFDALARAMERS